MKGGGLQDMAPNAKRALVVTIIFTAIAIGIYLFAIEPAKEAVVKERKTIDNLKVQQQRIDLDLRGAENAGKSLMELSKQLAPYHDALLTPLLDSYATRAKTILDPFATDAGLLDIDYSEESSRALPLPKLALAKQLYTRAVIKMTAIGSYQSAVSFLMRLEKELPLVSVQSFAMTLRAGSQTEQSITLVLEWPAKGAVTRK